MDEEEFECSECGTKDVDELHSLTEYGERKYGVDLKGRDFCEKCFFEVLGSE